MQRKIRKTLKRIAFLLIVLYNNSVLLLYLLHIKENKAVEILKSASAGTLESSDAYVEISPADSLSLEIESVVKAQFGEEIEKAVLEVLDECGIDKAQVRVVDRGALECVIRARVETAAMRVKEAK
jgi:citrate lyase subunit gamma (acyl carrier protein)